MNTLHLPESCSDVCSISRGPRPWWLAANFATFKVTTVPVFIIMAAALNKRKKIVFTITSSVSFILQKLVMSIKRESAERINTGRPLTARLPDSWNTNINTAAPNIEADASQAPPAGRWKNNYSAIHETCHLFLPFLADSDQAVTINTQQLIPSCQLAVLEDKSGENMITLISKLPLSFLSFRPHPLTRSPLDNRFDVNPQVILACSLSHQQTRAMIRGTVVLLWLLIFADTAEFHLLAHLRRSPWQQRCWSPFHCWEVCSVSQVRPQALPVPPI